MAKSEHTEQVKFVARLRQLHRCLVFAVPNGGFRNKKEAAMLKAEGVLAGVPDLVVISPKLPGRTLFVEMKTLSGKVSKVQQDLIKRLNELGFEVIIGHGCEDAYSKFLTWELDNAPSNAV